MTPEVPMTTPEEEQRRERQARVLGVVAAGLMAVLLVSLIRWPGPFVSLAVGYGVYRLAGGRGF